MKRTLVAILALTPSVLFAQAIVPAQPVSTPVLQSSLIRPAAFAELKSADPKAASTSVRVTTGVVAPTLLTRPDSNGDESPSTLKISRTVVLDLMVDPSGKPTDIKVVTADNEFVGQDAIKAVSQYRFKPATLDGQPTAIPMRLRYVVQKSVSN